MQELSLFSHPEVPGIELRLCGVAPLFIVTSPALTSLVIETGGREVLLPTSRVSIDPRDAVKSPPGQRIVFHNNDMSSTNVKSPEGEVLHGRVTGDEYGEQS